MRVLFFLAGLLLCVYSAPLQDSKRISRAKRAAEQVIFGNHQNNARVKKSGPGLATPLRPLEPAAVREDEEDIDKKALVTSKVTSSENDQEGQEDLSDDLENDTKSHLQDEAESEVETPPEDASSQDAEEMKDEETVESQEDAAEEDTAEENLQQLMKENESLQAEDQPSFPLELFEKNHLGSEYMDYPTYDYQDNPFLRKKRSLGQHKAQAVVAEDMMQGGSPLASSGRRSKRDLGQDVRYMLDDLDYPEVDRRGYEEEPELDENKQEVLEEMLREEMLKYNPELAEEVENEVEPEEMPYGNSQEAQDLALINYLYRNGYAEDDLGQDYEEEEGPEPWEEMGPAPQVALPEEEAPYLYPYGQYASEENVMNAPYSMAKRQYLSFVPGMRKRTNDFYPYAYGPDGRWGAMVSDEVMEKRAEERMYERLLRLAAALRDRRDELEAERYYADEFPEK